MKQEDYKYLLMLLKESVTEAFGKAKNNSFDDDEYAPDDYDDFSYHKSLFLRKGHYLDLYSHVALSWALHFLK